MNPLHTTSLERHDSMNDNAARSPISWVPTLYFAQGLPFYAVALVAGLMFKSLGVPNDQIARWTGAIGLAWVFKPLWSPFLELAASKKTMVVLFQCLGGLSLGMIALALQTPVWFAACVAVLAVAALASSTHDIVCDGLYIASLTPKQQAAYAGWQGAFFNAGKFISLGGLVILAGYLEKNIGVKPAWSVIFLIIGAMMLALAAYHSWSLPQVRNVVVADKSMAGIGGTLWDVFIDFLNKPGIWGMIAFIILFRAGEAQVQTIRTDAGPVAHGNAPHGEEGFLVPLSEGLETLEVVDGRDRELVEGHDGGDLAVLGPLHRHELLRPPPGDGGGPLRAGGPVGHRRSRPRRGLRRVR